MRSVAFALLMSAACSTPYVAPDAALDAGADADAHDAAQDAEVDAALEGGSPITPDGGSCWEVAPVLACEHESASESLVEGPEGTSVLRFETRALRVVLCPGAWTVTTCGHMRTLTLHPEPGEPEVIVDSDACEQRQTPGGPQYVPCYERHSVTTDDALRSERIDTWESISITR